MVFFLLLTCVATDGDILPDLVSYIGGVGQGRFPGKQTAAVRRIIIIIVGRGAQRAMRVLLAPKDVRSERGIKMIRITRLKQLLTTKSS